MKLTLNDEIIKKHGWSYGKFLLCLAIRQCRKRDILQHLKELTDNLKVFKDNGGIHTLYKDTAKEIENLLLLCDEEIPKEEPLTELARELINLYPKGMKDGTNMPWRANVRDIVKKLQSFYKIHPEKMEVPYETIIQATKEYIDSFNGNYRTMRVLKYFILKENQSDLATCIENLGNLSTINFDPGEVVV